MAFVVEDGTGKQDANSYADVSFADAYFSERGVAAWTGDAGVKQQALIKATDYIDLRFSVWFKGVVLNPDQALSFPRTGILGVSGVPVRLAKAACEYALRALSAELTSDPVVDDSCLQVASKTEKIGPITETTDFVAGARRIFKPYPAADMLITGLFRPVNSLVRS